MMYQEFKNKFSIQELLTYLTILERKCLPIEIDFEPDYEISPYKREITDDYYFRNAFNFDNHFKFLISAELIDPVIYHADSLEELESEKMQGKILYRIHEILKKKSYDDLASHSFPIDLDEFKLNKIRIHSIDNIFKDCIYEGSFFGDSSSIDPIDWSIIAFLDMVGVKENDNSAEFYKSLLAESYITLLQRNYKLSYFLLFTALENFINTFYEPEKEKNGFWSFFRICREKESKKRLSERLKFIFKNRFKSIEGHKVYSSFIGELKNFTNDRNVIAHGLKNITIGNQEVENKFYMVLTAMICYNDQVDAFLEMNKKITVANKAYN